MKILLLLMLIGAIALLAHWGAAAPAPQREPAAP
jgi:hypothetical protein